VSLILGLGFIKIILAGVIPSLGIFIGYILNFLCASTISIVDFISENISGSITIGKLPMYAIAAYYTLLISIANVDLLGKLKKITICLISITTIIAVGFAIYNNHFFSGLKLSVLSVGAGQCIIAKTNQQTNVFDIGSMSVSDVGNKIVNPYLAYLGSSKLDALFISHPDLDHINGICEVLSRYKTDKIYSDEFSAFGKAHSSALIQLENWLNDNGYQITENMNIPPDTNIRTIWHNLIAAGNGLKANDLSAVYLIEFSDKKILLCSDIEQAAQKHIMQLYPDLKADIAVSPHHGSVNTSLAEFIPFLSPQTIITSCSTSQYQRIIKKKPIQPKNSFWTSQNGCIEIYIDSYSNVRVKPFITLN
jgi:competence protein ComEC